DARLELRALERRQPILAFDFCVHEFDVGHGDDAGQLREETHSRVALVGDHELPAHPNDLHAVGVDVDLAIERSEAGPPAEAGPRANPRDGNLSPPDAQHGDRVPAAELIELVAISRERVDRYERVVAPRAREIRAEAQPLAVERRYRPRAYDAERRVGDTHALRSVAHDVQRVWAVARPWRPCSELLYFSGMLAAERVAQNERRFRFDVATVAVQRFGRFVVRRRNGGDYGPERVRAVCRIDRALRGDDARRREEQQRWDQPDETHRTPTTSRR